jgi:Bacterial Ig domain
LKRLALIVCLIAVAAAVQPVTAAGAEDCDSPVGYPGDAASSSAIAVWMAHGARARGIPGELPVMGALVESNLKNLNAGDSDAKGFFAMREAIWNQGEYAGFPDHPELQLKWFIDRALAVRKTRIAAGDAQYGLDPGSWGVWAADVLLPAEQYRGRYQLRLEEARQLIGADCLGFRLPQAGADSYEATQASPLRVGAPGVLANDSAIGPPVAALVSGPSHGTLALAPDGSFEYRGFDDFTGADSFSYRVLDGYLESSVAVVSLNVAPPPPPSNAFTVARGVKLREGSTVITLVVPGPGAITAQEAGTAASAAARRPLVKKSRKVVTKAGRVSLTIRPTTAGKRVLRRKGKLTARLRLTFTPTGGTPRSTFKKVTIRRR